MAETDYLRKQGINLGTSLVTAGATGGASIPFELILGLIGGGGGLAGLFGGADSPKDEAAKYAFEQMKQYLPELSQTSYSKGEVESTINRLKSGVDTQVSLAKTGAGTALAEGLGASGTPKGQPSSEIFVSQNAGLDAAGVGTKADLEKFGMEFWAGLDSAAKNRVIAALQGMIGSAQGLPEMTGGQKGIATGLQVMNLLAQAFGNIGKGYKDYNYEPIKP